MKENINTTSVLTIEQRQCLLHIWSKITYTLVFTGEATDLFQTLSSARSALNHNQATVKRAQNRLGQLFAEAPVAAIGELRLGHFIIQISTALTGTATSNEQNIDTSHPNVDYGWNTSLSDGNDRPQTTNICLSNLLPKSDQPVHVCENVDGEGDTVTVLDPEDNDDCDMEDCDMDEWLEIPPDLISESADLSQYRSESGTQTFKDTVAIEEPFLISHLSPSYTSALADVGLPQTLASLQSLTSMPTLPIPSNTEQCQFFNRNPCPNGAGQHANYQAVGQAGITDNVSQSSQLTPAQRNTKGLVKTKKARKRCTKRPPFPLINPLANFLIEGSTVTFFFDNRQSIYEAWTTTLPRCFNVIMSVIATFDMVNSLVQNKKGNYLKLRFAYIHLMRAIDVLDAARKRDPLTSQACKKPGYSINSVAINIYLNAKKDTSYKIPSRSQLSEYIRVGRCWLKLAGPSPFQLAVYTRSAETIMYVLSARCATSSILNTLKSNNYSITEPSLKALAAEVQHISPELVRILVSFGKSGETIRSPTNILSIE
jgi:hypothetical protein